MTLARALAAIAVLGWLGYFVALAALHVLPTGYSPVRHAVSDYGVGRYARWFRVAVLANAAAGFALVAGLYAGEGSPPLPARDLVLLVLIPLTRLAMSAVATDLEGRRPTRTGVVHYLLAVLGFAFTSMVVTHLTPTLRTLHPWAPASGLLGGLATVTGPALVAVVVTLVPGLRRVFGVAERAFLVTTNLWFLVVAALLVARPS